MLLEAFMHGLVIGLFAGGFVAFAILSIHYEYKYEIKPILDKILEQR